MVTARGKLIPERHRQIPAGGQAELRRQRLNQHRQQICHHDHPHQQVAGTGRLRRSWWRSYRGRRTRWRLRTLDRGGSTVSACRRGSGSPRRSVGSAGGLGGFRRGRACASAYAIGRVGRSRAMGIGGNLPTCSSSGHQTIGRSCRAPKRAQDSRAVHAIVALDELSRPHRLAA